MKRVLNPLIVAVSFLCGSMAYAKGNVEFHIQFSLSPSQERGWCKSASAFLFRHSTHPDGNPYDRWFERNRGVAFECAAKSSDLTRSIIGALPTSRDGSSFFFGKNIRFYTPEVGEFLPEIRRSVPFLGGLSIGIGAELVLTYYEFRDRIGYERALHHIPPHLQSVAVLKLSQARDGYIVAPVPNSILSVRVNLDKWGYLRFEDRGLGLWNPKAHLYSIGWSREF